MSDEIDWDFSGPDDAKAEIRAAVGYLLKDAAGSDCGDIARAGRSSGVFAWRHQEDLRTC